MTTDRPQNLNQFALDTIDKLRAELDAAEAERDEALTALGEHVIATEHDRDEYLAMQRLVSERDNEIEALHDAVDRIRGERNAAMALTECAETHGNSEVPQMTTCDDHVEGPDNQAAAHEDETVARAEQAEAERDDLKRRLQSLAETNVDLERRLVEAQELPRQSAAHTEFSHRNDHHALLCDVCNRCSVCDRRLNATPHVYVCACPEPHDIDLCPECRSKETAYQLTRTREDCDRPHFWSDMLSEGGPK